MGVFQLVASVTRGKDVWVDEDLSVAAVARRLGIAPATLRTWDRRYGLGPSHHEVGRHRKYSSSDLAKLTFMRRLIVSGVAPAHAAEQAKSYKGEIGLRKVIQRAGKKGSNEDLVSSLLTAANALDGQYLDAAIVDYLKRSGVVSTWQEILVPLFNHIGAQWEETENGVEVEHLVSEIVKRHLNSVGFQKAISARPVLLAAVHEEQHCLALYALRAALNERGIPAHFLGPRTPLIAIAGLVKKVAPPAIFLWALLPENADPRFIRNIPAVRPAPRIIIGGPGWDLKKCKDAVFAPDLATACEEIEQAIGA